MSGREGQGSAIIGRAATPIAACAALLVVAPAVAQDRQNFTADKIAAGAEIYERNCSPCHGPRMLDPQSAFNLRNFPHDQHDRFVSSVARGKNQMPPWGDMLRADEIEALWAYVIAGER